MSPKTRPKNKKKVLVLLDAHAILHRAYHALPDFTSRSGEPTGALYGLTAFLIKMIRELKPDYVAACYDLPEPTFRHEVYEEYKAGRPKTEDDLIHQLERSRDVIAAFGIPIYDKLGFEADDILGTIVEKTARDKDLKVIIASGDMDTLQLVRNDEVLVYTLKKGINDTLLYNEKAVIDRFGFVPSLLPDFKGLSGDPSDNIIGIAGIGEKTASALIQKFGSLEEIYKALKKDEEALAVAGIKPRMIGLLKEGEEEAFFSKTLATIRRDVPIEFSLPKKVWKESFQKEKAEKLFTELNFRTLKERLWGVLSDETDEKMENAKEGDAEKEDVSEEELKKLSIALWLLDSEETSAVREDILDFAGVDTLKEAEEVLLKEIKDRGLEKVYYDIELPLIPIIAAAQKRGILVDVKYLQKLSKKYHKELSSLERKIWKLAGEEFNINSPKQLGGVLFDKLGISTKGLKKTAGGARSTRESELLKLAGEHKIIGHILAYRELQKLLSTYIDNIPKMVGSDGRLHANLNQTGTTTGRMSSNNPNMQNIPARGERGEAIRSAFVAARGYKLVAFDYSQIEMRILAVTARDEMLKEVFVSGKDAHTSVASHVFGVPETEVTKDMRRKAKVINFGIMYGMGINALRANLGGTRAEAQEFYDNYFKAFPKIAAYFEGVKRTARKNGFTETLFGRRRYFEGINSSIPFVRAMAERQAFNAPLQGTAADIIKIAMKKADEGLKKEGLADKAHLLLQIHDELIYEVKEGAVKSAVRTVKDAMEHFPEIPLPISVNVSVGEQWGEMKEYKK
ncbi:MAG: hypothetical protein BMS9Abin13_469 [Patescibacteria group bacterium]|nr:MAG: hypothetical protein BMS9Abin13_469 [Patescibacteria group bacterium]